VSERIFLVEDEPSLQLALGDTLVDEGFEVTVLPTVREAMATLEFALPDLVICDLRLPDGDGLDVLRRARELAPQLPVIILTGFASIHSAVEAMKLGAAEYVTKPFDQTLLLATVKRHLELVRLRRRVAELESGVGCPVGASPLFRGALELARTVAASDSTVLIEGETGTGKEVVARYIHDCSPRRSRAFVAVSCSALPETLLESELFGHERGAFTGALRQRRGRFEEADGGTLFLDEVGEMSPATQAKLLRVLQEQRFERLGSNQPITVDVRIIAATRRNLREEVAANRFRDDLYYRLKVVPITLPPLRERPGDVALLLHYFAERHARASGKHIAFSPEAVECLSRFPFPGNVRELEHLVQRLAVVCQEPTIRPEHLPEEYREGCRPRFSVPLDEFQGTLAEIMQQFERRLLAAALERFAGHRGKMAAALGISRKNLWEKLKSHGLA
jgi:DNA-binding NtrC family response regulator